MSKRRRVRESSSSSTDEDEHLNMDESLLDVSCNELKGLCESDVESRKSSPVHMSQEFNALNPRGVKDDDSFIDCSQNSEVSVLKVNNDTLPFEDTDIELSQDSARADGEVANPEDLQITDWASNAGSMYIDSFEKRITQSNDEQMARGDQLSSSDSSASDSDYGDSSSLGECGSDESLCLSESDQSDEADQESYVQDKASLIYDGAHITVHESMTALLAYIVRHEISGKEITDLLNLVNLHCKKENNKMCTSLYFFKKYFSLLGAPVVFHYFCEACCEKLQEKNARCPNSDQHPQLSGTNVFVELPLVAQIQALYSKEEFVKNFNYSKNRTKQHLGNIEDIYDGQLYQELIEQKFFTSSKPFNFSTIMNTDGVPVFHSNAKSLWPIFLNVLELPPELRFKQEYTLIGGLWFGKKPHVNLMISPLLSTFNNLLGGFLVTPFGCEKEVKIQGLVLASTCDLPAKVMMLGMSSFSGSFGRQVCKIPGRSVKIVKKATKNNKKKTPEKESSVWVYSYTKDLELRSHQETVQFSREAQTLLEKTRNPKTNVFGVKFPSAVFKIMYDAIRGFAVDDLHTVYLGCTRTLNNLWFDSKNSSQPFSIRKHMQTVDQRIKSIKLPNFLERGTVTIEEMSHWKGKDFLTWLHYLSVPVLDGVLPDKYLEHHVDLVLSLHLLQSDSIPRNNLISCDKTLNGYVEKFEILYGTRFMTIVIHSLLHLFVVTNLGPLKYLSCFPYEGLNGQILKMIHGTRHIETQLASGTYLLQKLPDRLRSLKQNIEVGNFCNKLLHPAKKLKILEKISDGMFSVGTYKTLSLSTNNYVISALKKIVHVNEATELLSFLRLKSGKFLFLSKKYERVTKSNSYTCSFLCDGKLQYGAIQEFVRLRAEDSSVSYFSIFETAEVHPYFVAGKNVSHIMNFSLSGHFVAVPVECIVDMMVFIEISGKGNYVCKPLDHSLKS